VNLAVASEAARHRHLAQWGAFWTRWATRSRSSCDEAKALANWLQAHLGGRTLMHLASVPLSSILRQAGLTVEDLRELL